MHQRPTAADTTIRTSTRYELYDTRTHRFNTFTYDAASARKFLSTQSEQTDSFIVYEAGAGRNQANGMVATAWLEAHA